MEKSIVCPVSAIRVNESVVRTVATFIFLLSIASLLKGFSWISIFLLIDFGTRAFTEGNASLLKILAKPTATSLNFPVIMIDAAPKKFAALIGFFFAAVMTIGNAMGWTITVQIFTGTLIICSGLEAFAGICLGCIFYSWIVLPFKRIKGN
ncbi:MAG: DUF4395 domain-containing protein [Bacteroidota bacterium]|nr:DUF4395 domain-containing protein [Bacteroidota bacterium]